MHSILIKKEIENAFAQKKFIYMMLGMSILFPILIPMFDSNQVIEKIIPASFLACFIPNYIALNCSSQLIVNSYIEEVNSNISNILSFKKINIFMYYFSKLIIPFITGFACGTLSSIIFNYVNGPIVMQEFILIIWANCIWSLLPSILTLAITAFGIENEITLNTIMFLSNLGLYIFVLFLKNPFENIVIHSIYTIVFTFLFLFITHYLMCSKSVKLKEKNNGQFF